MRHLPDDAVQYRLQHEDVSCEIMRELGRPDRKLSTQVPSGLARVDKFGKFGVVAVLREEVSSNPPSKSARQLAKNNVARIRR
ncbi:MAG: hypothetical protein R3C56_34115 [Pirellulaceae bacterium]